MPESPTDSRESTVRPPAADGSASGRGKRWLLGIGLVLVLLLAGLLTVAEMRVTPHLESTVIPELEEQYGISVDYESLDASVIGGSVAMRNVRIAQGEREFLRADLLELELGFGSALGRQTIIDRLYLRSPTFHGRMLADGDYDFIRLFRESPKRDEDPSTPAPDPRHAPGTVTVVLRDLRIDDGTVILTGEPGSRLADYRYEASGLQVEGEGLQFTGPDEGLAGMIEATTALRVESPRGEGLHAKTVSARFDLNRIIRDGDVVFQQATIRDMDTDLELQRYGIPALAAVFIPPATGEEPDDAPDDDPGPLVLFEAITIENVRLHAWCGPESPWDALVYTLDDFQVAAEHIVFHGPDERPEAASFQSGYRATVAREEEVLADSGQVSMRLDFPRVMDGNVVVQELRTSQAMLRLHVEDDGQIELARLLMGDFAPTPPENPTPADLEEQVKAAEAEVREKTGAAGPVWYLGDARMTDSRIVVTSTPNSPLQGYGPEMRGVRVAAHGYHLLGPGQAESAGDLRVHGEIAQQDQPAYVDVVAWGGALTAADAELQAYAVVTGFDIRPVPHFDWLDRTVLGGHTLHSRSELHVRDGRFAPGQMVLDVEESGNSFSMRFSGPIFEPTVETDSSLLTVVSIPVKLVGDITYDSATLLFEGVAAGVSGVAEMTGITEDSEANAESAPPKAETADDDADKSVGKAIVDTVGDAVSAVGDFITGDDEAETAGTEAEAAEAAGAEPMPSKKTAASTAKDEQAAQRQTDFRERHRQQLQRILARRLADANADASADSDRLALLKSELTEYDKSRITDRTDAAD